MSGALPIAVILLGVLCVWGARSQRLAANLGAACWVLLAGGFAFVLWGDADLAAGVAVAAVAAYAFTLVPTESTSTRLRSAALGASVGATAAITALVCIRDAEPASVGQLVMFVAGWAALIGAAGAFAAAAGHGTCRLMPSVGLGITGASASILIAGTGRSSLQDAFYGMSLRTGEELIRWSIPAVPGAEDGITLNVAVAAPAMQSALTAFALAGLVISGLAIFGKRKALQGALAASAVGALGLLAALPSMVASLPLPDSNPYSEEVKRRLLAAGGHRVDNTGAFNGLSDVTVAMADLAPEILGLTLITMLSVVAFVAVWRGETSRTPDVELQRVHLATGAILLWIAWVLHLVIHYNLMGAPGMGSPAEWVFTGLCLAASGIALVARDLPQTQVGNAVADLLGGVLLASLLLVAGLSWRFGALPGMSIGIFG